MGFNLDILLHSKVHCHGDIGCSSIMLHRKSCLGYCIQSIKRPPIFLTNYLSRKMVTPVPEDLVAQTTIGIQHPFCLRIYHVDAWRRCSVFNSQSVTIVIHRAALCTVRQTQFAFHHNLLDYRYTVCTVCDIYWQSSHSGHKRWLLIKRHKITWNH